MRTYAVNLNDPDSCGITVGPALWTPMLPRQAFWSVQEHCQGYGRGEKLTQQRL